MKFIYCLFLFALVCPSCNDNASTGPEQNKTNSDTVAQPPAAPGVADTLGASGGSEYFFASKWIIVRINGVAVNNTDDTASLAFFPGQISRVAGSTGCNRLNGTFELKAGQEISFSPVATTRRACADGGRQEQSLIQALSEVNRFHITGRALILFRGTAPLIELRPEHPPFDETGERSSTDQGPPKLATDFRASGNEPFWSVEMTGNGEIKFRSAAGDSFNTRGVKPIRLMDVAASSYRKVSPEGTFNLVVYDRPCINDMSGDTVAKTVELYWKEHKFTGCGEFLGSRK